MRASTPNSPPQNVLRCPPSWHRLRATRLMTHKRMVLARASWLTMFTHWSHIGLAQFRTLHILILCTGLLILQTEQGTHRVPWGPCLRNKSERCQDQQLRRGVHDSEQTSIRTSICPGPCRYPTSPTPPFRKLLSPQPAPPPTLFAGVGSALAPPATELVG